MDEQKEQKNIFKKILGYVIAFLGGIATLLFFRSRRNGNSSTMERVESTVDRTEQRLNTATENATDLADKLGECKDTVERIEHATSTAINATSESTELIDRITDRNERIQQIVNELGRRSGEQGQDN